MLDTVFIDAHNIVASSPGSSQLFNVTHSLYAPSTACNCYNIESWEESGDEAIYVYINYCNRITVHMH